MSFKAIKALGVAAATAAALALSSGAAFAQNAFTIQVDGSSTVFPIAEAVAEGFQQQTSGRIRATVGESGTGGGFRKFCRGEIHVANASRPIKTSEMTTCASGGVRYVEIPVAFDGIAVVTHPSNPVRSATVAQLRQIWAPAAQGSVMRWNQVNPAWPNLALQLFGPGSASGTFEYFTEAVVGTARSSRTDYTPSEDDNVIVQGVANNPGGMGYFGLAYFEENQSRLNALSIDSGSGPVAPSVATVANGTYAPLSRPLFVYFNADSLRRPQVLQFAQYFVANAARYSAEVGYIPLPASAYQALAPRLTARADGTAFGGRSVIGATIEEVLQRRLVRTPVSN